jgi:mycothiol synthase
MSQAPFQPQLVMLRQSLESLQPVQLPPGYSLRTSTDSDGVHWARIVRESFGDGGYDEASFVRIMKTDPAYRPERIFFVCDPAGEPCATASAYRNDRFDCATGCVHFVGTCPGHAGKRLGYAVTLAVLHQFRAEDLARAVLLTDDFRLAAIKTYLNLGFVPLIVHENQPPRWDDVYRQLGLSVPATYEQYPSVR